IQAEAAQGTAHLGQPRLVREQLGCCIALVCHGAELEHAEDFASAAKPGLGEEYGSPQGCSDYQGGCSQQWACHDKQPRCGDLVEALLDREPPSHLTWVRPSLLVEAFER